MVPGEHHNNKKLKHRIAQPETSLRIDDEESISLFRFLDDRKRAGEVFDSALSCGVCLCHREPPEIWTDVRVAPSLGESREDRWQTRKFARLIGLPGK